MRALDGSGGMVALSADEASGVVERELMAFRQPEHGGDLCRRVEADEGGVSGRRRQILG